MEHTRRERKRERRVREEGVKRERERESERRGLEWSHPLTLLAPVHFPFLFALFFWCVSLLEEIEGCFSRSVWMHV